MMKYQLILQFPLNENFDFDSLIGLETELTFRLGSEHVVDGHDIGSGTVNIFINTDEPTAAFKEAKDLLTGPLSSAVSAAYRAMDSDQYHWIHPANNAEEFRIG